MTSELVFGGGGDWNPERFPRPGVVDGVIRPRDRAAKGANYDGIDKKWNHPPSCTMTDLARFPSALVELEITRDQAANLAEPEKFWSARLAAMCPRSNAVLIDESTGSAIADVDLRYSICGRGEALQILRILGELGLNDAALREINFQSPGHHAEWRDETRRRWYADEISCADVWSRFARGTCESVRERLRLEIDALKK